jgi:hypothetical protein
MKKPRTGSALGKWFSGIQEWVIAGIVVLAIATILIARRAYQADHLLVPIGMFALVAGLAFEYFRLFRNLRSLVNMMLGMYALSFTIFLFGHERNSFNIERTIQLWPFWFCFLFCVVVMVKDRDRITLQLDEGSTLLKTLAFCYWLWATMEFDIHSVLDAALVAAVLLALAYTLLHAFTPLTLSRAHRLLLSVWSTLVVFVLGLYNVFGVWDMGPAEYSGDTLRSAIILLSYFMLGISSLYMVNNFYLLAEFLPSRGSSWSSYRKDLKELVELHVRRFNAEQVPGRYSLYCILYSVGVYALNAHFGWVPHNTAIWCVIVSFPVVLHGLLAKPLEGS